MKKILYPVICFILLCLSFVQAEKKSTNRRIEEDGAESLILKPFQMFGILWSCSRDDDPDINAGGNNGGYNGGIKSDTDTYHTSHYSQYHSSHSSHYSSSHLSHQSHQSHSSHYSAR